MKPRKYKYSWIEQEGKATCTIIIKGKEFTGIAYCHPDDEDMKSEKTGKFIAEMRATVAYLTHIRDNELKPQLAALTQLYNNLKASKKHNEKSYEIYILRRQIRLTTSELTKIKQELTALKQGIKDYIKGKECFYQAIRMRREALDQVD